MDLRKLEFDSGDNVITEKKLRKRIKENFSMEQLQEIYDVCLSNRFSDNNEKVDTLNFMFRDKNFLELGAGTNRYAMLKDNYVFKFSLDHYGFDDNWTEFNRCADPLLQPLVTKTYECNGLLAVAEYCNVISLEEFHRNREKIRSILEMISTKYLFADLGCIDKNFRNWGYNDKNELVILDYGYIFERDDVLMRCTECHHRIGYDTNFDQMVCEKCGKHFTIHDIKSMMECDDEDRAKMFAKKEKVKLSIGVGSKLLQEDKAKEDVPFATLKFNSEEDEEE